MTEKLHLQESLQTPEKYRPIVDVITISGHPGTGKTVVGSKVAQECGMEFIKVGELFREYMLQKFDKKVHGFTTRPEYVDEMFDKYQRLLIDAAGRNNRKIVLEGRLAGLIATEYLEDYPHSQKGITRILFTAESDIRRQRVANRYEGLTPDENERLTREREKGDMATWKKFHPRIVDLDDLYDTKFGSADGVYPFADIVIDTTQPKPDEVTTQVLHVLEARGDIVKIV